MTDQKPCPKCGFKALGAAAYRFIPVDNLRWHSRCWEETHPKTVEDQKEKEAQ